MSIFPERLKYIRNIHKLSQQDLANNLSLSRGLIGNYEIGTREPDFDTLLIFANYFKVSTDYLLGKSDLMVDISTNEQIKGHTELINSINSLTDESKSDLKKYIDMLILRDRQINSKD